MGLPKQVMDMDAESDENLNADVATMSGAAVPPNAEQPQQVAPVQQETQAPKAAEETPKVEGTAQILDNAGSDDSVPEKDLEALRLENQRMRSMMGRLSKEHKEQQDIIRSNEEMKAKLAEREAELERLRTELEQSRAESVRGGGEKLSEDMMRVLRAKLGDGYSDDELANFAAAVSEIAGAKTKDIREKIAERERMDARKSAADFKARLEQEFPGFIKMDAENDPHWVAFLKSSLPGVMEGTTYGEVAALAARRLDYRKFASVVREFQKAAGIVFSPEKARGDEGVAEQMRPQSVSRAARGNGQEQPKVFARSEINAFFRAYQARRAEDTYGMSEEQVADRIRLYEDAEAEGRVDESR